MDAADGLQQVVRLVHDDDAAPEPQTAGFPRAGVQQVVVGNHHQLWTDTDNVLEAAMQWVTDGREVSVRRQRQAERKPLQKNGCTRKIVIFPNLAERKCAGSHHTGRDSFILHFKLRYACITPPLVGNPKNIALGRSHLSSRHSTGYHMIPYHAHVDSGLVVAGCQGQTSPDCWVRLPSMTVYI